MRIFNKDVKEQTVRYDSIDYVFPSKKVTHVKNFDLGKFILQRNPNLVDYDILIEEVDQAKTPAEKEAMLTPVTPTFSLPPEDAPQFTWIEKAKALGVRGVGKATPKPDVIKAVKDFLLEGKAGKPPGPPIPAEPEIERLLELKENAPRG